MAGKYFGNKVRNVQGFLAKALDYSYTCSLKYATHNIVITPINKDLRKLDDWAYIERPENRLKRRALRVPLLAWSAYLLAFSDIQQTQDKLKPNASNPRLNDGGRRINPRMKLQRTFSTEKTPAIGGGSLMP